MMKHSEKMHSMVPLIGMILLVIMANGLIAVFGFSYHNLLTARAQDEMEHVYDGVDRIREAQIHFKRQVQEWKNILLRGHDPEAYVKYANAFQHEQGRVRKLFDSLTQDWSQWPEIAQGVPVLADQLDSLNARYAEAISRLDAGASAQDVDGLVRGMDRPLEVELDALVRTVEDKVQIQRQELREEDQNRYKFFRKLLSFTTATGCILALVMLVLLMRRHPGA